MACGDSGVATVGATHDAVSTSATGPSPELQARAEEKRKFVQQIVQDLDQAIRNPRQPQEKEYLRQIINPDDPCFRTLINLLTLPKYAGFVALRCVVLRAIQMILKVAVNMLKPGSQQTAADQDANVGMKVLIELVGKSMAEQAFTELCLMVDRTCDALVACDAMLVLAELGPKAFEATDGSRVTRLLDLFAALPDRASELVEVALRVHAWGGATRATLAEAAVTHDGGRYLGEVLLQMVNRGDRMRRLRAVKIYSSCFVVPNGTDFLYTNDKRVLVEILMRELPLYENAAEFVCYAECFKVLVAQCEITRDHKHRESIQVFADLGENELSPPEVREKCAEVLALLRSTPVC
jgi:hypothetical protein